MAGPLGNLRGLYFDSQRNRYFPNSRTDADATPARDQDSRGDVLIDTNCDVGRKRPFDSDQTPRLTAQSSNFNTIGRSIWKRQAFNSRRQVEKRLASATLRGTVRFCGGEGECRGEKITSIQSFGPGGMYVTTDHGRVILCRPDGRSHSVAVCSQELLGLHCNVARMTWLAVSNGNVPHVHAFRRDPDVLSHYTVDQSELNLPQKDIYAMSAFDDVCTLASIKSLNTVRMESNLSVSRRELYSDPLAVHHASRDLVFAGLRASTVLLEDLRVRSAQPNVIASMRTGRAVIGVRRLKDSAVPWGLIVSGMDNQLAIFDVRYANNPLLNLDGHVNSFHTSLALATSPDDTVVFAGGSDRRLRAWSTLSGQPIVAPFNDEEHALSMTFPSHVEYIDISEDLTLMVASDGLVLRYFPVLDSATATII